MIILFVEDMQRRGNFSITRRGTLLELPNNEYQRHFKVVTNDLTDGPHVIASHLLCPKRGDTYLVTAAESDIIATCIDVEVEPNGDSPFCWLVTAKYSTDRLVSLTLDNPLNVPPEIFWDFIPYERPITRDLFGIPLVTSSKERYDPPWVTEEKRPILRIRRNEATFSPANALAYQDTVNQDIFAGAGQYAAKINHITGRRSRDFGLIYWEVDYEIEFRRETFWLYLLDQGWRDKDGKLFRDPINQAQPLSNPSLLNGRGEHISKATTTTIFSMTRNDTQILVSDGITHFPTGPVPGTPDWYFNINVEGEIMTVIGGFGTNVWTVIRGVQGSSAVTHATGIKVTLEPYYRRYMPYRVASFAPLNLPAV
jgi:hypothetical protein